MTNLMDKIEKFKEFEIQREIERRTEDRNRQEEIDRKKSVFNVFYSNHLVRATKKDYEEWLSGWLETNEISHYYGYEFKIGDFYVATSDFILKEGFYGASSFQIIVPKGIQYTIEDIGHCNIYDLNNIECFGGWVPCFSDIIV